MRRIPDPVIFVVLVIVVSAAISAAMMPSVVSTRHLAVMRSLTLAPVVSIIVCALGFPLRRRLAFATATVGIYALTGWLAVATGFDARAVAQASSLDVLPSPVVTIYIAWLTTMPFAGLLLFVGRTPARLWRREAR